MQDKRMQGVKFILRARAEMGHFIPLFIPFVLSTSSI